MPTSAIFRITDGTNSVNLINQSTGFKLESWRQVPLPGKGEGIYQSSPIADGRRLVSRQWNNTLDRFDLIVNGVEQDAVIYDIAFLFTLLEKAAQYWTTDWQQEPVWLEARAGCETNLRYAHIINWRMPELSNPYSGSFLEHLTAMGDVTLLIEHTGWRNLPPGEGNAIELSAVEAYDGRNLGNVDDAGDRDPTTNDEVYIVNKRNQANITDIYIYDTPAFLPGNYMDAALPFNMLPAIPVAGDIIYFGIDTTLANSGPFNNLVFDIATAQTNITNIDWEYWNGGAWAALTINNDNTANGGQPMSIAGVNSVHWEQPANWATTAVNGITGYWVRLRVLAVGANPTPPVQQNRDIYSCIWPYIEIQAEDIGGDVPAMNHLEIFSVADVDFLRIILGLRSISRGDEFTACLNAADEQNVGFTCAVGVNTAFINDVTSPTGRIAQYNPAGADTLTNRVAWTFQNTIAPDFVGEYHCFVRYDTTGTTTSYTMQVRIETIATDQPFISEIVTIPAGLTTDYGVADMGKLPFYPYDEHVDISDTNRTSLRIYIGSSDGTDNINIIDCWLIPTDEWAGDFELAGAASILKTITPVVDSVTLSKKMIRSPVLNGRAGDVHTSMKHATNGPAILQSNVQQRLWFFVMGSESDGIYESQFFYSARVLDWAVQRYIAMRGNR